MAAAEITYYEPVRRASWIETFEQAVPCQHCGRPPQLHGFDLLCLSQEDAERAIGRAFQSRKDHGEAD